MRSKKCATKKSKVMYADGGAVRNSNNRGPRRPPPKAPPKEPPPTGSTRDILQNKRRQQLEDLGA
jgi:hypothetical protein